MRLQAAVSSVLRLIEIVDARFGVMAHLLSGLAEVPEGLVLVVRERVLANLLVAVQVPRVRVVHEVTPALRRDFRRRQCAGRGRENDCQCKCALGKHDRVSSWLYTPSRCALVSGNRYRLVPSPCM